MAEYLAALMLVATQYCNTATVAILKNYNETIIIIITLVKSKYVHNY